MRDAHLVPRVRLQGPSATIQTVTDQTHAGGELAASDSTGIVEINTGPTKAKIPTGVVGSATGSAERLLVNAGFTNVITRPGPNVPDASAGTVTGGRPDRGPTGETEHTDHDHLREYER